MRFAYIQSQEEGYPTTLLCKTMQVSPSAYYDWKQRPARLINPEELNLYRRAKSLFQASRNSLGSRELCKKLRTEGFEIGREKTRTLMRKLGLKVRQRQAYRVTTLRKKSDAVADNLLNQNFNPVAANEIWAGDITYLRTAEGWVIPPKNRGVHK